MTCWHEAHSADGERLEGRGLARLSWGSIIFRVSALASFIVTDTGVSARIPGPVRPA